MTHMEEGGEFLKSLDGVPVILQLEVQRLPQLPPQHRLTLPLNSLPFSHFSIRSSEYENKV